MPEQRWKVVCTLLCLVGFFKSLRPSEPFLTQYLLGPRVNLTLEQLTTQVFPVVTYSNVVALLVVLFVTDFLRYKAIIICEALTFAATYVVLIYGKSLEMMQLAEVVYAVSISCEIAYYTYMYAKVNEQHYQKVTSYARAAVLTGIFLEGVIGQVLIITHLLDYYQLNFISLSSAIVTFLLALFLPHVPKSIYFRRATTNEESRPETPENSLETVHLPRETAVKKFLNDLRFGFKKFGTDLKYSYSNSSVLKWSIWWSTGTCLHNQVINYIQPLWEEIYPSSGKNVDIYNGAVESLSTFLGAIAALVVGFIPINWSLYGELALTGVCVLDAACLCLLGLTEDILVAYSSYVTFRVAYQLLITIASFQVARNLKPDTYSLIFGFNTFVALIIQSLIVVILVDKTGFGADPKSQFIFYAAYSIVLGAVFLITGIYGCIQRSRRRNAHDDQQVVVVPQQQQQQQQ